MYDVHTHETTKSEDDSEMLRSRIAYLELLLCEADHRISNSLHLALAVTARETDRVESPVARAILQATERRIEAIADIHRLLISDVHGELIALNSYLAKLVAGLGRMTTQEGHTHISMQADPVRIEPDLALWIGLILNELVFNSCKHARRDAATTNIHVGLKRQEENLVLEVQDDGRGISTADIWTGTGMGARIVAALTKRLGGQFHYEHGPWGTKAILMLVDTGR